MGNNSVCRGKIVTSEATATVGNCIIETGCAAVDCGTSMAVASGTGGAVDSATTASTSDRDLDTSSGLFHGWSSLQNCHNIQEQAEPDSKTPFSTCEALVVSELNTLKKEAEEVKKETEEASSFKNVKKTHMTNTGLINNGLEVTRPGMGGNASIFDKYFLDTREENDFDYTTRKKRRVQCKLCIESGVTTMVMICERSRHMRRRHLPEETCEDCGKMFRPIDRFDHKKNKCSMLLRSHQEVICHASLITSRRNVAPSCDKTNSQ